MRSIDRREAMRLGAIAVAALAAPMPALADAAAEAAEMIKKFSGGKEPTKGKISLDLPEIAENGNTVPLTVAVESPMTAQSHVQEVLILAEANPNAGVAHLTFSPMSGKAEASLRIRLAKTQNVVAVAKTSDGGVYIEKKTVKVTIGGCGG